MPKSLVGYSKRGRLDKLGVKPGMRVAVLDLGEPDFVPELKGRTADVAAGKPRKDTDMVFLSAESVASLRRLPTLERVIRRNGAIWVLWPKGQKHITEDLIRAAAIQNGLVDVKVIAFSDRLSGLKLVIPIARR